MVDDYSFPDPTFDYISFIEWLSSQGYKPDLMIRESQLIPVCDQVLDLIQDRRIKGQIVDYIKSKQKYPCSLFIAAWYLLRLGKVESDILAAEYRSGALINILPESFKPFEEKGIEIIKAAGFEQVVGDIHYKFLSGRLVA